MLQLAIILSLLLVVAMPIISAENVPLTKKEISRFKKNEFGLVSYGHFWQNYEYHRNVNDEYIDFNTQITIYNTYNESITLKLKPIQFSEEREHSTIRENYTYYKLPNLDWVNIPEELTIEPFSKYTTIISTQIPVAEAYEQNKDGGFIFLITMDVEESQLTAVPAYKVFVTLLEPEPEIAPPMDITHLVPIGLLIALIFSFIIVYIKDRKIEEGEPLNEE